MAEYERRDCPACGRAVTVLATGRLMTHVAPLGTRACPGSGTKEDEPVLSREKTTNT